MNDGSHSVIDEVAQLLQKAKSRLISHSSELAKSGTDWHAAERVLEFARSLDQLERRIRHLGGANASTLGPPVSLGAARPPTKLPYYYTQGDRLVKRGHSFASGSYEHKVPKARYDIIIRELVKLAQSAGECDTSTLLDKCHLPSYQPSTVLGLLIEHNCLRQRKRGLYAFLVEPGDLASKAAEVWASLPSL